MQKTKLVYPATCPISQSQENPAYFGLKPEWPRQRQALANTSFKNKLNKTSSEMVAPILKWAGGKRSLIPHIIGLLPPDYKKRIYHEPFFGGGALFFTLRPTRGSINDINPRLINFYRVVRDDPENLIKTALEYRYEKETFYKLRDHYNCASLSPTEDAALTLYLNKTAFNGLYRVNSKGKFNVPFGRYTNPTIVDKDRIRAASKQLQNIEIMQKDFSYVVEKAEEGSICYFDPPYLPVSDTANFTSYARDGFTWTDQVRLHDACIKLHESGVYFVLSNSYVEKLIDYYRDESDFSIHVVQANRAINSKAAARGPVKETLITNIPAGISGGVKTLGHFIEN